MQVKTFRATTINQALDLVRKELGPNAIILGNKKVDLTPNESYVEVMAAIEPDSSAPAVQSPSSAPAAEAVEGKNGQIQGELQEIKSFLSFLVSSKDYFSQLRMEQPMTEIYHSLLARGLDEKQTYILLRKAMAQIEDCESVEKGSIIEAFSRKMLEKMKLARPFHTLSSLHRAPHVFTFLGPTGVGKTTTLAKLAAYLKIKRRMEVGLISSDTYRIGAIDQLQTYANILDIPLIVAQNKSEFHQAVDRFRHQDVILVDTIGKNYLSKDSTEELRGVFDRLDHVHHLLVLSATAKDGDLRQTIMRFRPLGLNSLIFTKVDETLSHGNIINQLLHFPHPLSYLGTGQKVPEDIELATQKRLLSFLFPSGNNVSGKD